MPNPPNNPQAIARAVSGVRPQLVVNGVAEYPWQRLGSSTRLTALTGIASVATEWKTGSPSHPQSSASDGKIVFPSGGYGRRLFFIAGLDADNASIAWRVLGLMPVIGRGDQEQSGIQWVPTTIAAGTGAQGARTGAAGAIITDSMRFVDTITITEDRTPDNGAYVLVPGGTTGAGLGPGTVANDVVMLSIPTMGFPFLQFDLKVAAQQMDLYGSYG